MTSLPEFIASPRKYQAALSKLLGADKSREVIKVAERLPVVNVTCSVAGAAVTNSEMELEIAMHQVNKVRLPCDTLRSIVSYVLFCLFCLFCLVCTVCVHTAVPQSQG